MLLDTRFAGMTLLSEEKSYSTASKEFIMKKIVVTMGDPGGIGPEVTVKALCVPDMRRTCNPLVVGRVDIIREAVKLAGLSVEVVSIKGLSEWSEDGEKIKVLDVGPRSPFRRGACSAEAGRAVVSYVEKAVELVLSGDAKAVVTAPVSKESLAKAGFPWRGHTELIAQLTGTDEFAMMFVSERLRVILSTIHVPLSTVPLMITEERLLRTFRLAEKGLGMLGIQSGRIAVAGLNPHAGESGLLGEEEERVIIPAIKKASDMGLNISGPYPPDVVFHKAYKGNFDIVVCMYHDQGLIPFKMLAFETGVNMTVGLPVIRTSPDHGTGFDIAWKNKANPSSMIEAVKIALKMTDPA